MNDEQGSFYLLSTLAGHDNSCNSEREDIKTTLERVENSHGSFMQRLVGSTPNEDVSADKLPMSCQSPPSPHSNAVPDGSTHVRENVSDNGAMNETGRTQGNASGDQWIQSQLEDYMVYQGLTFTNNALGENVLASNRINQIASGEVTKVENNGSNSNSSVICQLCNKSYSNKAHLMRHMQSHTNLRPYKCDLCHLAFRNTSRLKRHKETHSGVKPYKCPLCEAKVSRKEHLKRHMIIHTDSRPFKCSLCPFSAKRIDSIKHHIRQRHVEGMATVTTLHFAPAMVQNLLGQLQSSSAQPIGLPATSNSQQNVARPTGSKKKKKKSASAANNNMSLQPTLPNSQPAQPQQHDELLGLILSNNAPVEGLLPCDMCNKSFTDQAKLNRHKFSHLAVKPFICDICGARLSRQDHLKRHMYMHESSHPLLCGSCRYATNKLSDLRVHIKNQHPGERIRILSSLNNSRSNERSQLTGLVSVSPEKRDSQTNQIASTSDNNVAMSLVDTMVLPQGESIYSAGTWCPSTTDSDTCPNETSGQQMSKRKRKNPQKCQVTMEGGLKVSEAGLVSSPSKDGGASGSGEQSLRIPVPPLSAPLMVPSYNLMHSSQYNLGGQTWKQPNSLTNLGVNYASQAENNGSHFITETSRNRSGIMDLRQSGQFENGHDEHVKHNHCGNSKTGSVKNEKAIDNSHLDNRRSSPIINIDGSSMHQLAVSSRLLSDASLRSGLPRMNEVWGAHFVDKTGWLRMPNAQGFTTPFFNNGMPNFVFNWPLQQGLPISPASKAGNSTSDKLEPSRSSDSNIVGGPNVYNAYDLADLSNQPTFFGQGWPHGMNPY